jgi:hypothetical protein
MVEMLTAPPASAIAAGLISLAAVAVLTLHRAEVRGTTLAAAWSWSCVSLGAIAGAEILVGLGGGFLTQNGATALRFGAAMTSFCPIMALLGAKRPQDRGWQFIVLSLWVVLALPSFEWLMFGRIHEIHPARFWFLVILVGIGALNGIATRFWPSSLLYCLGQMALIAPYLPPTSAMLSDSAGPLLGLCLMTAAWTLLAAGWPRAVGNVPPLDRVWLDFRDAYGAAWSLRVAERMNASAALYEWPVTLGWRGFRRRDTHLQGEEVPAAVEESLRGLLRRFVSPEWFDLRLGRAERQNGATDPASLGESRSRA